MKPIKPHITLFVLAIMAILHGCVSINRGTPSPIPTTLTSEISPTIALPTYTTTIAPTLTFMPVATLSSDEAYALVSKYLNNGPDCHLPCWMGITPGQSTLLDLHSRLTMLSGIATEVYDGYPVDKMLFGRLTISYPNDNYIIETNTNFISQSGEEKISAIGIYNRSYLVENGKYVEDVYGYPAYNDLFSHYTLSGILASYGLPDQIYIVGSIRRDMGPGTPNFGDHFWIDVWYPNQGIFMTYDMSVTGAGNNYRFCPTDATILGLLIPSGLGARYHDMLLKFNKKYQSYFPPSKNVKMVEEALRMTKNEFYNLFRVPTKKCLETPKSLWWPK